MDLQVIKDKAKEEVYNEIVEFSNKLNEISSSDKDTILKIKENIRRIRKRVGLTPNFFETQGIMKYGTLINIEKMSYIYKPNIDSCVRFAYGCGIDIMEILEGIDV